MTIRASTANTTLKQARALTLIAGREPCYSGYLISIDDGPSTLRVLLKKGMIEYDGVPKKGHKDNRIMLTEKGWLVLAEVQKLQELADSLKL